MTHCINPECNTRANFNYSNETKGLYCNEHKLDGMVNVVSKKCNNPDCNKQPWYNYMNEKKGLYCTVHKLDGMIDILHKKCNNPDCIKQPIYNYSNETKGLYCSARGDIPFPETICCCVYCFHSLEDSNCLDLPGKLLYPDHVSPRIPHFHRSSPKEGCLRILHSVPKQVFHQDRKGLRLYRCPAPDHCQWRSLPPTLATGLRCGDLYPCIFWIPRRPSPPVCGQLMSHHVVVIPIRSG